MEVEFLLREISTFSDPHISKKWEAKIEHVYIYTTSIFWAFTTRIK